MPVVEDEKPVQKKRSPTVDDISTRCGVSILTPQKGKAPITEYQLLDEARKQATTDAAGKAASNDD